VLCSDKEVKRPVFHEGNGPDAPRLQTELRHHLEPREGEDQHIASSGPYSGGIHGPHGAAKGQQHGGQVVKSRTGRTTVKGFPYDAAVVHGDERSVIGGEAADDGSLLHNRQEPLKVHLGFGHPSLGK